MFTCGTSHYLKHKFGVGYNLTIVKEENCDSKQLENLIMKHVLNRRFDLNYRYLKQVY